MPCQHGEPAGGPHRLARVAAVAPLVCDPETQKITSAGVNYLGSGERKLVLRGKKRNTIFNVMGPTLAAGFCRRHILESTQGFSNWVGPDLADADFASTIDAAGLKCDVVPDCRLVGQRSARNEGFYAGRRLERLYWRQAKRPNARPNLIRHLARIGWYSTCRLPRWSAVSSMLGRLVGMMESGKDPNSVRDAVNQLRRKQNSPTELEHRRAA